MPQDTWDFPARERWSRRWTGSLEPDTSEVAGRRMNIGLAWSPYVVVAVLLVLTRTVRILINPGEEYNSSGLSSMPITLAEGASVLAGSAWPVLAPWIGALGAFIAGSNTVSN